MDTQFPLLLANVMFVGPAGQWRVAASEEHSSRAGAAQHGFAVSVSSGKQLIRTSTTRLLQPGELLSVPQRLSRWTEYLPHQLQAGLLTQMTVRAPH